MGPTDVLCDAIQNCFEKHLLDFERDSLRQLEYSGGTAEVWKWQKGGPRYIKYMPKGKRGFHRYVLQSGHPRVKPLFPRDEPHFYDFTHRETSDDDY